MIYTVHLAATWYLTGLIWTIHAVHYPLFSYAEAQRYPAFHRAHMVRITPVVAPMMVVEMATGIALLFTVSPLPVWAAWAGFALIVWNSLVTFGMAVPCHRKLLKARDEAHLRRLLQVDRLRAVGWSLRALLVTGAPALS